MKKIYTNMRDDNGKKIYVGDILKSEYNYRIRVRYNEAFGYYGKLICNRSHCCANIPYALNDGNGYVKETK